MEIINDLEKLSTPAKPLEFLTDKGIEKTDGEAIIKDLHTVMAEDPSILALAAPQIGYDARIFCIRFNDIIKTFINPIITKKSGSTIAPETFIAMPGKEILIARPNEITTVYYTDEFKYEDNKLLGAAARLFDQQYQLLDGILPDELGLVSDVEQDGSLADLTEEEISKITEIYKQFIAAKVKSAEETISQSKDLNKAYTTLKLTESVVNGRTEIVEQPEALTAEQKFIAGKTKKAIAKSQLKDFIARKRH